MGDFNTTTFPTTNVTTIDNINTTISPTTPTSTELINTTTVATTTRITPGPPSHVAAIAGGVTGGIVFLVIIAAVVFIIILRRRRRKRKRRKEKLDNLPLPPSVNELETAEIKQRKHKNKWSKKSKPNEVSSSEPHYVNEQIGTLKTGNGKSEEPLYVKPEPPKRDLYSGVDGTEYYMEENIKTTGQEPSEVYSDPNIPGHKSKDEPHPAYTNSGADKSVQMETRDYENVPAKRTEPPKANTPKKKPDEVAEDEEQTVYENT